MAEVIIVVTAELSMVWVDPRVGLGWVGNGSRIFVFSGLGWVMCLKWQICRVHSQAIILLRENLAISSVIAERIWRSDQI